MLKPAKLRPPMRSLVPASPEQVLRKRSAHAIIYQLSRTILKPKEKEQMLSKGCRKLFQLGIQFLATSSFPRLIVSAHHARHEQTQAIRVIRIKGRHRRNEDLPRDPSRHVWPQLNQVLTEEHGIQRRIRDLTPETPSLRRVNVAAEGGTRAKRDCD